MAEHRWFCKYRVGGVYGDSFCVVYGYPDFNWSVGRYAPIYKHEIPKEFWDFSIVEYIDYFENNVKPRMRSSYCGQKKEEREENG